ncbi:DNA cytosine methyltransferase [Neolewinella lacunae]|uniref:Cytosine-specific methyltransferase n=1 Tax=Neolewinella lacunae TaxID=1517758 RepID=A0A923TE19_9BACT|nr:DNA cytosine methyltransferase [Neolewinella lacunae]MBC6995442.1 DNA cytosine methyltransferase [Neolewinella lacunae]MDN3635029.1 DNA cytosine methyltransferase [Neolewinella lacunae]
MSEVKFIDLFAGAGGFGLGFSMAGLRPILSLEKDKFAAETIMFNCQHKVVNDDVLNYTTSRSIKKQVDLNPDVIIGGPPCQGFSVAGSNRSTKFDARNNFPLVFLEWVSVLKPRMFVMENVPGILTTYNERGSKIIDSIRHKAFKIGYNVAIWKLNAANFGVPQRRIRVFIIGYKGDIAPEPPKAKYFDNTTEEENLFNLKPAITVGDAILDLPVIYAKEGQETMKYTINSNLSSYQKWARNNSKLVYNHVAMKHTPRMIQRYQALLEGKDELPDELKVRKRNGNGELSKSLFNSNYRHLSPNLVSYTIPASFYSSFVHPTLPRNITTREAARLQSFPDTYFFKGQRTLISNKLLTRQGKEDQIGLSQYNQVGNAVPPLLACSIAEACIDFLKKE